MEDDRGTIEDYMHRYGYGPKEAEAMYRLKQARNLFKEIYDADAEARAEARAEAQAQAALAAELGVTAEGALEQAGGTVGYPKTYAAIFQLSNVTPHFDALEYLIVKRSLDRQYPEGWGRRRQEGEGTEEG